MKRLMKATVQQDCHPIRQFCQALKSGRSILLFYFLFGCAAYSLFMTGLLGNSYDDLWHKDYYISGTWDLSIGRWMNKLINEAVFGVSLDPFSTLLSILIVSVSLLLLLDLFHVRSRLLYPIPLIFLCSPSVCSMFAYRYMTLVFSSSIFFSVLAAWAAFQLKSTKHAVLIAGLSLACSMGCYQAQVGIFLVIALFLVIDKALKEKAAAPVRPLLIRTLAASLVGAVLYLAVLFAFLKLTHTAFASYRSLNETSAAYIAGNLPGSLKNIYSSFVSFCLGHYGKYSVFLMSRGGKCILLLILLCPAVLLLYTAIRNRTPVRVLLLGALCALLMPIAALFFMFLSPGTIPSELQMTGPLSFLIALYLLFGFRSALPLRSFAVSGIVLAASLIFLHGSVYMIQIDQGAMLHGLGATKSITMQVLGTLTADGIDISREKLAFVGRPSASPLFHQSEIYKKANAYGRFGDWWLLNRANRSQYLGVIKRISGIEVTFCSNEAYDRIIANEALAAAPCYPAEGSIMEMDGVTVVKISGEY